MSWIAGILRFDSASVTDTQLSPMLDELARRPHDDVASWHDGPVGLAHLALRVTPEDHFDSQPRQHTASATSIVFDGRLDNRKELGERLQLPAGTLREFPDSKLALHAWLKWGEECCKHLLGDFAFAIWDARTQRLLLFRDHIGLRPLFYTQTPDYFAFASHSAALRTLPDVDTALDERWVGDYLSFTHHRADLTAYRGIRRLPGAYRLTLGPDGIQKCHRYWSLSDEQRDIRHPNSQAYYDEFRDKLQTAINVRLRGVGPVSSMLSGGLDSSAITAIASETLAAEKRSLIAVSSVLADDHHGAETDEKDFIEALLKKHQGIEWRPVTARGQTAFSDIPALLDSCDQPTRDLFYCMTLALFHTAQASGARTILSGFGGDAYVSAELNEALLDMLLMGQPVRAVQTCLQEAATQGLHPLRALRRSFAGPLRGKLRRLSRSYAMQKGMPRTLNHDFAVRTGLPEQLQARHRQRTPGFFISLQDESAKLECGLLDEALYSHALMGKSAGLDVSMPLMDKELISYCANLPLYVRRHGGLPRSLLRTVTRELLPQEIAERTCKGAFLPDHTRRTYQAAAELLPPYESGMKPLPAWLNFREIKGIYQRMDRAASGFNQGTEPLINLTAPLLIAEFLSQRWP